VILAAFQRLSDITDDMTGPALSRMEPVSKEYLLSARDQEKARDAVMGRDLLKRLGAFLLRCETEQVVLAHDAAGRPYLMEAQEPGSGGRRRTLIPPGFCSLSHSRAFLLAAVSDEAPVGCDTDHLRSRVYPLPALAGFFSEHDLAALSQIHDPGLQRLALTRLWTRKEAVFKLIGKTDRQSLHLLDKSSVRDALGIFFSEQMPDQKEVMTVAVKSDADTSVRWVCV